ncbi:MAG: BREX-2 system adenine-specific DNA-methyltransferase PglX [Candidatus Eisenbacteria bacterium]|nr:BREX-2 system adenine-specific DNA-methyltransferase PglX [Candidatus Eisenbacteria bacterium]
MAGPRKTSTGKNKRGAELVGQEDPRAPLDSAGFLAAAQPVLSLLTADLLERADGSVEVSAELRRGHAEEVKARRTAEVYEVWRRGRMVQVAAAWLLSCVFVRVLEDRGLLGRHRLAGPGAEDSQRVFGELAPYLGARDYVLTIFRELARIPATAGIFDARHNLVWRLAPSQGGVAALLDLLRAPHAEAPAFRFGQVDTRFLGDLYQDLSADVRETYALLQTPDFVEAFILDRTLEPAIVEYGVDAATILDPTCGSGHFLLGAFERLFDRLCHEQPGLPAAELANRAMALVHGVDLNPYAVAIARFRLTLAYWQAIGLRSVTHSQGAPPRLNVVAGDSLLYAGGEQGSFGDRPDQQIGVWTGLTFALDEEGEAKALLSKRFAAVVGNPPYITVKDAVMREEYRRLYTACFREYALSAPFLERFFQLARPGGFTGQITSNAFMKREYGKKVVEEVLPKLHLTLVVNTAGAYIPGHGTPTVILCGRNRRPEGEASERVLAVLSKRGEPSTPADPAKGAVWTSILEHWHEVGYDGEYISVEAVRRDILIKHPWSLEGGGAGALKELLEARAEMRLGEVVEHVGTSAVTGEDDVYILDTAACRRLDVGQTRPLVMGEKIRDWALETVGETVFPYDDDLEVLRRSNAAKELRYLWPYRTNLSKRKRFGTPMIECGLTWYELRELYANKLKTPLSIAFAEIATHNHFVLDRGGKVFKQTAPIIKLPEGASEDDHLALLAYLNSSTACFWLKQVAYPKGAHSEARPEKGIPDENRYAFSSTAISMLPVPDRDALKSLTMYAKMMERLQAEREVLRPAQALVLLLADGDQDLRNGLARAEAADQRLLERMVAVQEGLDWAVYPLFGLSHPMPRWHEDVRLPIQGRPFAADVAPDCLDRGAGGIWQERKRRGSTSRDLSLIENAVCKRKWWGARGVFASKVATYEERAVDAARDYLGDRLEEACAQPVACARRELTVKLAEVRPCERAITFVREAGGSVDPVGEILARESVPFLAAYRYTDAGAEKRALWEQTWELQRLEDAGRGGAPILVPPKYDVKDFRDANFYRLRGKLDVPKERFISYPGCESDEDGEPIYGWAGWDHLQRAAALVDLFGSPNTFMG